MASYAPGRPSNERDTLQLIDGSPQFLGVLVSTGAAVNNATTATPFAQAAKSPQSMAGTLAGRVLMVQASVSGFVIASTSSALTLVAQAATFVPPQVMGPLLQANERVLLIMQPTEGWLQFLPSAGSANLFVWELV